MKYEIKLWEQNDYGLSRGHISTLVIDVGTLYDDWETARTDPGKVVIGREGKGTAKIYKFGVLYLYEHYLGGEILLTANWKVRAGRPIVGMTGFGQIEKARSPQWNGTRFNCQITKAYTWLDAAVEHTGQKRN